MVTKNNNNKSPLEKVSLLSIDDDYIIWTKPRNEKKFSSSPYKYLLLLLMVAVVFIFYFQSSVEKEASTFIATKAFSSTPRFNVDPTKIDLVKPHDDYKKFDPVDKKTAQDNFFNAIHTVWSEMKPLCRSPNASIINPKGSYANLWFTEQEKFTCPKKDPLTSLDQESGLLYVNSGQDVNCSYSYMFLNNYNDNKLLYTVPKLFTNDSNIQLNEQFSTVNVSCTQNENIIYQNVHMFIPKFKFKEQVNCTNGACVYEQKILQDQQNRPIIGNKKDQKKPNVLIFFLESMSVFNFNRTMTKTKNALELIGNFTTMNYFVKPLDNSFPNTMAMLTGERIPWVREKTLKSDYFDHKFRYLWDYFHGSGYVTGFMEDLARIGIFKYGKWGFNQPPVDFYPRPFWLQMYPEAKNWDLNRAMQKKDEFCYLQNGKKIKIFLNQILDFVKKQEDPYFLFSFYSQMTHNNLNSGRWVDDDMAEFFLQLQPHLNNTILVFAGDHGFRMSSFVGTSLGRLQERMNLVTVRIPDSLDSEYPHLRKFLRANQDRLTSWFDVHLMLREFATGEFKLFPSLDSYGSLNVPTNPARQLIHPYRTCSNAGILPEFCVCNEFINVAIDGPYISKDVQPAGLALAESFYQHMKEKKVNCRLLPQIYNSTVAFKYILKENRLSRIASSYVKIFLIPCNCTIESFMKRDQSSTKNSWTVDDAINSEFGLSFDYMISKSMCFEN